MDELNLSVIILSYNTKDILDKCLQSLQLSVVSCQKNLGNKIQIIVLDNASSDGSVEMVKKNHPEVDLIESKENTGYSKGNNLAFKKAKYPLILFLNSDVYLQEDSLEKALLNFKNPDCDGLGIKLQFENGKFQPSAGDLPNFFNIYLWIFGFAKLPILENINPYHPTDPSYFNELRKVGWVTGAFFMLRKEVFEKVLGFDENLFMYAEEVEMCKRISKKGCKIWYVPTITATHLHAASSNFDTSPAFVSEIKGLSYYFKKYYKNYYWFYKIIMIKGLILRIIVFTLFGKTKRANAYMKGLGMI